MLETQFGMDLLPDNLIMTLSENALFCQCWAVAAPFCDGPKVMLPSTW